MKTSSIIAILCTVPEYNCANTIARVLIAEQLAACVNILGPITSIYRWQEQVAQALEIPLLIKTTKACLPAISEKICALHPYELPEILVFSVKEGLPKYLQWVADNVCSNKR